MSILKWTFLCTTLALLTAACSPGAELPQAEPSAVDPTPANSAEEPTVTKPASVNRPGSRPTEFEPSETPTRQVQWGSASSIELNQAVEMVPGDVVSIAGTEVEILLVEAHGPGPDCHDCPNSALLLVRSNGETQKLKYTFSGNMLRELLIKAKRKEAFGHVLIAERIDDGSFTLRVEPDLPQQ